MLGGTGTVGRKVGIQSCGAAEEPPSMIPADLSLIPATPCFPPCYMLLQDATGPQ